MIELFSFRRLTTCIHTLGLSYLRVGVISFNGVYCLHFQWNALWHAHICTFHHPISVDIVVVPAVHTEQASVRTNKYVFHYYYLFKNFYVIFVSLRFITVESMQSLMSCSSCFDFMTVIEEDGEKIKLHHW